MTVGDYLKSLSTADSGATALTVVGDIEGTYPVLTPIQQFKSNIDTVVLSGDIDTRLSADMSVVSATAVVNEELASANLKMESIDGNFD